MKQYRMNVIDKIEYHLKGVIKKIILLGENKKKRLYELNNSFCTINEPYHGASGKDVFVLLPLNQKSKEKETQDFVKLVKGKLIYNIEEISFSENSFFYILTLSYYPEIAKLLRKHGLIEGKNFISTIDGKKYRLIHEKEGIQKEWKSYEIVKRLTKKYWEERVSIMSSYIDSKNSSILDIGCWDEKLKKYIPTEMVYYGCDYIKRQDDTIVCDLNNREFPNIEFDCAFISGNLEYIVDVDWYFDNISRAKRQIILSYSALEYNPYVSRRKNETWVNHLTINEIVKAMNIRGFELIVSTIWEEVAPIMVFRKRV